MSFRVFLVWFLLGACLLAAGVVCYWQYVGNILEREVRVQVEVAGRDTAEDFNRAVSWDQQVVNTIAITVQSEYPWKDKPGLVKFLQLQTKYNHFKNLGVITLDGQIFSSQEKSLDPKWVQYILGNTLEKEIFLSDRQPDPEDGNSVLVAAAILHSQQEPIGALFAVLPLERYQTILELPIGSETGFAFVVDEKGDVEVSGQKLSFDNIFTALRNAQFTDLNRFRLFQQEVENGQVSFLRYNFENQRRFAYGYPLSMNRWYLVSVLPTAAVERQARMLTWVSLGLFIFIFFIFFLLAGYLLRLRAYNNQRLFTTAFVDTLTGADNLARMNQIFPDYLEEMPDGAALAIFDITKFKVINDLYGYERGNQVLQRVADIIRENLAEGETFCRSTADNFVLLLKCEERSKLRSRLNKIATQIRRDCTANDACLMVDSAFGVYEITEDIPFFIMLDRAHLALEYAKNQSGDKIQFYDEKYRRQIVSERRIENSMELALEQEAFSVFFQPKCDLKTGKIRGAEALVRWKDDERGLVRPDEFIPLFERNGFILRLDMFILERVVQRLAKWEQEGKKLVPVSVNFSRQHLNDSRYIPQITRVVDKYRLPHDLIEVELTENMILDNIKLAQNVVRGLHNKGFSVSMDDFGSGYSSLNVLKNLQFDSIKLDKEFLAGFNSNENAKQVIKGTVEMLKSLKMLVIAEGVETEEQVQFLRDIGCDVAQGYFYAKPLAEENFKDWLH